MKQCLSWYVSYDIGLKKAAKTTEVWYNGTAWYKGTLSKVLLCPLYKASTVVMNTSDKHSSCIHKFTVQMSWNFFFYFSIIIINSKLQGLTQ